LEICSKRLPFLAKQQQQQQQQQQQLQQTKNLVIISFLFK
jgi:hypothetical protein